MTLFKVIHFSIVSFYVNCYRWGVRSFVRLVDFKCLLSIVIYFVSLSCNQYSCIPDHLYKTLTSLLQTAWVGWIQNQHQSTRYHGNFHDNTNENNLTVFCQQQSLSLLSRTISQSSVESNTTLFCREHASCKRLCLC